MYDTVFGWIILLELDGYSGIISVVMATEEICNNVLSTITQILEGAQGRCLAAEVPQTFRLFVAP